VVRHDNSSAAARPQAWSGTYPPNVPLARDRLTSLHVSVVEVDSTTRHPSQGHLPFVGEAFDLVMSRHDEYVADEVARVLRGGGRLVTQQVGDRTNLDLHQLLGAPEPDRPPWSADVARVAAEAAGLRVLRAEDAYPITRFHDVGAIAYYLKAVGLGDPRLHRGSLRRPAARFASSDRTDPPAAGRGLPPFSARCRANLTRLNLCVNPGPLRPVVPDAGRVIHQEQRRRSILWDRAHIPSVSRSCICALGSGRAPPPARTPPFTTLARRAAGRTACGLDLAPRHRR
jgi:hypothetical protein